MEDRLRPGHEPFACPSSRHVVERDAAMRGDFVRHVGQYEVAGVDGETFRRLGRDQRIESRPGPEGACDDAPLVEIELGEPPQRIAAEQKAVAERYAVDARVAQALDPAVRFVVGPIGGVGRKVRTKVDGLARTARANHDARATAHYAPRAAGIAGRPSTSSAASSTRETAMPSRQSGVWPTHRAGGLRTRLHGLHGRSMRTARDRWPSGPYRPG